MVPTEEEPVRVLSTEECWTLLADGRFGRLAYWLVDELHLVPVNYVATDDRTLLFRTAAGNKLLAAALDAEVAFETDWHDDGAAWSVEVRGRLRRMEEDEAHRADAFGLESWVPTRKDEVVELCPASVAGRRFFLVRPGADR